MTPDESNKLNKKSREQREINKKTIKYCNKCKRNREVSVYEWVCPVCNTRLRSTSIVEKEEARIARENQRSKDNRPTIFDTKEKKAAESNKPKCPTCGSTNIKKISDLRRGIHATAWGIFSNTARSQFECKNCGYKW